ncbi:MAG: PCRF domain-containing protein, partial [Verrucomicrobiota bacterium]
MKIKIMDFRGQLAEMEGYLEIVAKRAKLQTLEAEAANPEFWNDQAKAQANIAATKSLKMVLDPFDAIASGLDDAEVMLELAEAGEEEALAEAASELEKVESGFQSLEMQSLLG